MPEFISPLQVYWEKYRDISPDDVQNTKNYIFHKFKKGIYVEFKNGQLIWQPFNNPNYKNGWKAGWVDVNPRKYENFNQLFERVCRLQGIPFKPHQVSFRKEQWYANNGLIRYEHPMDNSVENADSPLLREMFDRLAQHLAQRSQQLPNMAFFVHKRDFPILSRDGYEPYDCIFGERRPLVSHSYKKYAPILSMCTTIGISDIPIPTWEDWKHRNFSIAEETQWADKIPKAVFRGSTTGLGTTRETNLRLKMAFFSLEHPNALDVGITKRNARPRKTPLDEYFDTFADEDIPPLVGYLTMEEQSRYKYILHLDGHVASYRLGAELRTGSVVLLPRSKWKLWYSSHLEEYKHYVPLKEDCSDILDVLEWCRANDDACREIAQNAKRFADEFLCEDGILEYLEKLLLCIHSQSFREPIANRSEEWTAIRECPRSLVSAHPKDGVLLPEAGSVFYKANRVLYRYGTRYEAFVYHAVVNSLFPPLAFLGTAEPLGDSETLVFQFTGRMETLHEVLHDALDRKRVWSILESVVFSLKQLQETFLFCHHSLTAHQILISNDRFAGFVDVSNATASVNYIFHSPNNEIREFDPKRDVAELMASLLKLPVIQAIREIREGEFTDVRSVIRQLNLEYQPPVVSRSQTQDPMEQAIDRVLFDEEPPETVFRFPQTKAELVIPRTRLLYHSAFIPSPKAIQAEYASSQEWARDDTRWERVWPKLEVLFYRLNSEQRKLFAKRFRKRIPLVEYLSAKSVLRTWNFFFGSEQVQFEIKE